MRKLTKPDDDPGETFRLCISKVKSSILKARLESVEKEIVAAAEQFEEAALDIQLCSFPSDETVGFDITAKEMKAVYNRMVNGPGREVYDKILSSPSHGRCPLCGQRIASTLDHYLPKAHFPVLSVVPVNLVPACSDCNKKKFDDIPATEEERILHPYFDNVDDTQWLYARVIEVSPPALKFFVRPPEPWDDVKTARVKHHFKVLELASLYASHAAEELFNLRYSLDCLASTAGVGGVKSHLKRESESRKLIHVNSWQTAMYMALETCDWFCEGGFNA